MVTWVLYLCIGIVIGGMAGFYFAKLDDFSKKQKRALEEKLQQTEQELIDYKDQVTTHFKETATLINNMTESYQKVHKHLARGSVELCNNAIEVNKLEVSPNQLLTDSAQNISTASRSAGAETADKVLTEKAESEAPKDARTEENNKKKENVDVTVSATHAAVDDVTDDFSESATETVDATTAAKDSTDNRSSQTVATSPDSSTKTPPPVTPSAADIPAVIETMAVAEELDESADTSHLPGSRLVH